jgi:hypothetical protein
MAPSMAAWTTSISPLRRAKAATASSTVLLVMASRTLTILYYSIMVMVFCFVRRDIKRGTSNFLYLNVYIIVSKKRRGWGERKE